MLSKKNVNKHNGNKMKSIQPNTYLFVIYLREYIA